MPVDFVLWIPGTREKPWNPNDGKGLQFNVNVMRADRRWHGGCFTSYTSTIPQRRLGRVETVILDVFAGGQTGVSSALCGNLILDSKERGTFLNCGNQL